MALYIIDGFPVSAKVARPAMYEAHRLFWRAVDHGEIKRETACEQCSSERHVEAHHDDYSKPLVVRWLCASCHSKHHWALRKKAAA